MNRDKLIELVRLKARFFVTSGISTLLYWGAYFLFRDVFLMNPVLSNVLGYLLAVLLNFTLQKLFIFDLNRSQRDAFLMSIAVSIGGLGLSTLFVFLLSKLSFFQQYELLMVMTVSGVLFFYNFYLKRYSFEKKFF